MAEMAIPTDVGLNLQDVALELVAKRAASSQLSRGIIETCFRDAKMFLEVAEEALTGGLNLEEQLNPLDNADAPNLRKNHPLRVISQAAYMNPVTGQCDVRKGLNRIAEIWEEVQKLPANLDKDFIFEFKGLDWKPSEINQARLQLPAILDRAKKMQFAPAK